MADSTMTDVSKMKVIDLRKELKSRGLASTGDKAELISRLQAAMSQDEHGDINLDSDEIDSDGVLEDEDDKCQTDILDDTAVDDSLNEELALEEHPSPPKPVEIKPRILKRKITTSESNKIKTEAETAPKKIVLHRTISLTQTQQPEEKPAEDTKTNNSNKVKITADVDPKTRLEQRAKRFGLPIKMTDAERKEARKQRFGQVSTNAVALKSAPTGTLSENIDKLKKRAERFGQSVSKIMTVIENKEKLEKRKAKFGNPS